MNHKLNIILVGICFSPASWSVLNEGNPSMPPFAQGQGALSYTFFNLSGQSCTLTPEGAGPNPSAYAWWGQNQGWVNSGQYDYPGMFNPDGIPYVVGMNANYTQYESKKGTSDYFTSSYIFFDWPYSPIVSTPGAQSLLNGGTPVNEVLVSSAFNNWTWNTPAMGDSWSISCTVPSSTSAQTEIAVANFATSQNALQSGNTGFYVYNSSDKIWYPSSNYWFPAYPGWFASADINPIAEGNPSKPDQPCYGGVSPSVYTCSSSSSYFCLSNQDDYTNPYPSQPPTPPNPCGAGFTSLSPQTGSQSYNWNPQNSNTQGGLWSGINYSNYASVASPYPAVLNINMPMLPINLGAYVQSNSNNPAQLSPAVAWTPVMGGHLTYAIGDPFVISSFAAKILAYLATNPSAQLNNASNLASISYSLMSSTNPVFTVSSIAGNYVQWLMGSQSSSQNYPGVSQLAASAFKQTYTAAQNNTQTTEKIWGKIFQGLADTAIYAVVAGINLIPGGEAVSSAAVAGLTAEGTGFAIKQVNSAISSPYTTTTDPTTPLSMTAPAVVNPTYSSTNLLGLYLTNSGVQDAINNTMGWTGSNPSPLLSNYSVYIDQSCDDNGNTLGLLSNLLTANCTGVDGSAINGSSPSGTNTIPPVYQNVYAGKGSTPSTNQLSIWSSILTGSDIVVNEDGWLMLGDYANSNSPFQPPTQLYSPNIPSTFPSNATYPGVNTTFNPNTFTLTAQSVQWNIPSGDTCTSPATALNGTPTTCEYSLQTPATLNYMSCVSDQNATGGIIAYIPATASGSSLSGTQVVLACACIPTYLGGGGTVNSQAGAVTGATSANSLLTCPQPS